MNTGRRGFLKGLPFLAALVAPAVALEACAKDGSVTHRGWKITWSGWNRPVNQHVFVGYWLASRPDYDYQAYSAYPGDQNWMAEGAWMDISVHRDQVFVNPDTPIVVTEKYKEQAFNALLHFLDTEKPPYWAKFYKPD